MNRHVTSWPVVGGSLDGTVAHILGDPKATTLYEPVGGIVEVYRWRDGAAGRYEHAYDETL